jgi:CheY-like chemotaxis protein
VVVGNLVLARGEREPPDGRQALLAEAQGAAERAASLTRQLLAYSRRQLIQPHVTDLNDVLTDIEKLLQRVIGEDVALITVLEPLLSKVRVDRSQVEQVVVNLAANARDAMPEGGSLVVETGEVVLTEADLVAHPRGRPGRFVRLSLTDDGVGMTDEVRGRLFEPFFTTKGPGQGTGLGLAVVEGAVGQNGGFIEVESEPGEGTTFRIHFPALDELEATELTPPPRLAGAWTPGPAPVPGLRPILLVEDEEDVRRIATRVLEQAGYAVVGCSSGEEALAFAARRPAGVSLLVTDVVMPGIRGTELASRLGERWPGLTVLFTSGWSDTGLGPAGRSAHFLPKPYAPSTLAAKVRELLGEVQRSPHAYGGSPPA